MKSIIKLSVALVALGLTITGLWGQTITAEAGGTSLGSTATLLNGLQDITFHFEIEQQKEVTLFYYRDAFVNNSESSPPYTFNQAIPLSLDIEINGANTDILGWGWGGGHIDSIGKMVGSRKSKTISMVASKGVPCDVRLPMLQMHWVADFDDGNQPYVFAGLMEVIEQAGLERYGNDDYGVPGEVAGRIITEANSQFTCKTVEYYIPAGASRSNLLPLATSELINAPKVRDIIDRGLAQPLDYFEYGLWMGFPQHEKKLVVPAWLIVDQNRDGGIDLSDLLGNTAKTPYRFWSNDDDDSGSIGIADIPGSNTPDGQKTKVQGVRDLIDYFPVFLDIKQLLKVLPPGTNDITYKLKQADSGVRFIYTDLEREDAFNYLTDNTTGDGLKDADAHWATAAGYELDAAWLGQVKDADKGVILVAGRNKTDKPLVLSIEKSGTVIAEVSLNITSVRQ